MKNFTQKNLLASFLVGIGFVFFALLFWYPFGFHLGGDAYFLGKYEPMLDLYFPYAGLGFFAMFLGNFLKGKSTNISENQILFFLLFLAVLGVEATFSLNPSFSILFMILWAIGFFLSIGGNDFLLEARWKKITISIGILLGLLAHHYFPHWSISMDLIAIMAIYLAIFIRIGDLFRFQWVWVLACFLVVFLSQNNALILFSIVCWMVSPLWLNRSRRIKMRFSDSIPVIVLFLLQAWNWGNSTESTETLSSFLPIAEDFKLFLMGVGEGQFFMALHYFAPSYILNDVPVLPEWGIVLTFFEQGLLGVFLIILLGLSPIIFNRGKIIFLSFLFLFFWIVSAEFLGTENGILLALAFLFAQKEKKT